MWYWSRIILLALSTLNYKSYYLCICFFAILFLVRRRIWGRLYITIRSLHLVVRYAADNEYSMRSWWRHQMETFPCYWPFLWGIHRLPVNSPHKGQWRGALMLSLICAWINSWVSNNKAGDLRRHRTHHDVSGMFYGHHNYTFLFLKKLVMHLVIIYLRPNDICSMTFYFKPIDWHRDTADIFLYLSHNRTFILASIYRHRVTVA